MDMELVNRVAEEYTAAIHNPHHPSYAAFTVDTANQYLHLLKNGWKFFYVPNDPYETSEAMFRDCDSKVLKVFTGGSLAKDNILANRPSLHPWDGKVSLNEMFRAVHDINGHYRSKSPFETFDGEIAAYHNHRFMYSPEAQLALYGETVGQLCYQFAHGEFVVAQECKIIPIRY